MEVNIKYSVIMGALYPSEWMPWSVDLTDDEAGIYQNAIKNKTPLNEITELKSALCRVYQEIKEYEVECATDYGDEFDVDNWEIRIEFDDPNER